MPRWRVDLFRKVLATLGTVEAADEKTPIPPYRHIQHPARAPANFQIFSINPVSSFDKAIFALSREVIPHARNFRKELLAAREPRHAPAATLQPRNTSRSLSADRSDGEMQVSHA